MPSKTIPVDSGIMLAPDWMLIPIDSSNWELCHRHENVRGKHAGDLTWHHCGRYYQHSTIEQAVLYVADQLMKAKARDELLSLGAAMSLYRDICDQLAEAVRAWRA